MTCDTEREPWKRERRVAATWSTEQGLGRDRGLSCTCSATLGSPTSGGVVTKGDFAVELGERASREQG